ncbi:hypothetical protein [Thermococcus litoralis]|uniref:hypothetical protein n=1 Tax=Thermococcus litoralis TaxID=2265 RepID=UPI00117F6A98|nr:hypothetical protein [Thermococcus litoralis]
MYSTWAFTKGLGLEGCYGACARGNVWACGECLYCVIVSCPLCATYCDEEGTYCDYLAPGP